VGDLFSGIGFLFQEAFTRPIFNVLLLLYRLFVDFGLSIVVLTLIVKLVLFPLTLQQLKSTKANQALQPQLQEIRRKYAKDQRALMEATQALYKEYGINPMAGCLPLLIQLPVLYGLYFAFMAGLHNSTHLAQDINNGLKYPFISPFENVNVDLIWFAWLKFLQPAWPWVISLSQPDPTHLLPIIAALATFVQMRMSFPKAASSTIKTKSNQLDPTTSTMKTMQYIMPFFTLFISWSLPSGLALYWTVSSIFQAVQQYFVTGWGSLLELPEFLSKKDGSSPKKSASSNGASSSRKESTKEQSPVEDSESIVATASSPGIIAAKMHTTTGSHPNNGSSSTQSAARRSRNASASARRRSGTQRPRR
jgi:YidC/Oxa1 family membrane protein insertase